MYKQCLLWAVEGKVHRCPQWLWPPQPTFGSSVVAFVLVIRAMSWWSSLTFVSFMFAPFLSLHDPPVHCIFFFVSWGRSQYLFLQWRKSHVVRSFIRWRPRLDAWPGDNSLHFEPDRRFQSKGIRLRSRWSDLRGERREREHFGDCDRRNFFFNYPHNQKHGPF